MFFEEDYYKFYMIVGILILSLFVYELCLLIVEEFGNRKRKFVFYFKYVMFLICFDNLVCVSF